MSTIVATGVIATLGWVAGALFGLQRRSPEAAGEPAREEAGQAVRPRLIILDATDINRVSAHHYETMNRDQALQLINEAEAEQAEIEYLDRYRKLTQPRGPRPVPDATAN